MFSYKGLYDEIKSTLDGEPNFIANLSNAAALLYHGLNEHKLGQINWAGFYLSSKPNSELVLGPFQGKVACTRLQFNKGVCGTSAAQKKTLVVANVHEFDGHVACDSASESEIVIPIFDEDHVYGVLDIDCLDIQGLNEADQAGLEPIVYDLILPLFQLAAKQGYMLNLG